MKVADIDPLIEAYSVEDKTGYIGSKSKQFGYLKPEYRNGRKTNKSFDERTYKANPPWMKRTIIRISGCSYGGISIHVESEDS